MRVYTWHKIRGDLQAALRRLAVESVADTVNCLDDTGILRVGFNAFPKLRNVLIKSAAIGKVFHAPALPEDRGTIENLIRVLVQQTQDLNIT